MSRLKEAVAIDLAAEMLRRGRPMQVQVFGESMWPLVRQGDRVRIDPAEPPAVGRLAAVLVDGHLVVHRIVKLDAGECLLLGDHGGGELRVAVGEVLGVVTHQWTRHGRLLTHAATLVKGAGAVVAAVTPLTRWPWRAARRGRALPSKVRAIVERFETQYTR